MVKVIIEEDGKVVRTTSGNIVAGFVTEKSKEESNTDGKEINSNVFMVGGASPREIISSLSIFCIEVVTALSKGSEIGLELGMAMFKETMNKMESGKVTYAKNEGGEE